MNIELFSPPYSRFDGDDRWLDIVNDADNLNYPTKENDCLSPTGGVTTYNGYADHETRYPLTEEQ